MNTDFLKKYNYKILDLATLTKKLKLIKGGKKIVMCHGVFDVVHPGHIRHLIYAKSKCDILLVSITSDQHIDKGLYRPHVPAYIRATNLAAFEMIDYVLIDKNKTPNKNLKILKPNFFAKGFEYGSANSFKKETLEEKKIVESYGGEMIFTPGDIVYSSSKFLNYSLPKLQIEKLMTLMHTNKIEFKHLRDAIKNQKKIKVHVVGDTIIDTYTRTALIGGQIKTPTLSVLKLNTDNFVGGAGVVAQHLQSAGADVEFTTIVGDDPLKNFLIKKLKKNGVKLNLIIDNSRPTTNKETIIDENSGYRLLKVDTLDNSPISNNILDNILNNIKKINSEITIFSDFRHGIFNKNSVDKLVQALPKKIFKVADSQVASRWGNIAEFKNFDLITPNEREARFSLANQDASIGRLSSILKEKNNYKNLILKMGEKGIFCSSPYSKKNPTYFSVDSFADNVKDAVGAGDALLAYASLALYSTKSLVIASIIGSVAAACECELDGNEPIEPIQILDKINILEKKCS